MDERVKFNLEFKGTKQELDAQCLMVTGITNEGKNEGMFAFAGQADHNEIYSMFRATIRGVSEIVGTHEAVLMAAVAVVGIMNEEGIDTDFEKLMNDVIKENQK